MFSSMKCAPATKGEKRYCRLCGKKETRKQCAYGGRMWDRYAVKDATEGEKQDAAEESGITNGSSEGGNGGMSEHWIDKFEKGILEANKSGDNSLHDWFSKSKSSDGKLVGCNSVVNLQENPVPNNLDKPPNQNAVPVR